MLIEHKGKLYEMADIKHYVVLIHGIRTRADWQDMVKETLETVEGIEVRRFQYGRFDLLSFLLPGPTRLPPIKRTKKNLSGVINDARKRGAKLSVIAHSYGTYAIANILHEDSNIEIDNLIFCGSIVNNNYDWYRIRSQISGKIINDFGVMDVWPVAAKSITWGYGDTGTYGIGDPIEDRRHSKNHSGFFERDFVEIFWKSFFSSGHIYREEVGNGLVPKAPFWFDIFSIPWRYVLLSLVAAGIWFSFSSEKRSIYSVGIDSSTSGPEKPNSRPPPTIDKPIDSSPQVDRLVPALNSDMKDDSSQPIELSADKPKILPVPKNVCVNLSALPENHPQRQTQISESSFSDAKIKSRIYYVKVRGDPKQVEDNVICEMGPGTDFRAVDLSDGWSYVRLSTGHLGFMKTTFIDFHQ
jgi:hypothetical protein